MVYIVTRRDVYKRQVLPSAYGPVLHVCGVSLFKDTVPSSCVFSNILLSHKRISIRSRSSPRHCPHRLPVRLN